MHEDNIYLGLNLLGFLDKIANYRPMVEALILIFLGDLANILSLCHFHFKDISLIVPYFTGRLSVSDLWILKIDKNHFFPNGHLIMTFFHPTIFFFCILPRDCL